MKKYFILVTLLFFSFSNEKIAVLYRSLNPQSISEHLAFYQLFPETAEGKKALAEAWTLLSGEENKPIPINLIPEGCLNQIVNLVTKEEGIETELLSSEDLSIIKQLASHLPNRKLKGFQAQSEAEVLALPSEEIDLAHGLFLSQTEINSQTSSQMASYESLIDLMALQILTKIKISDTPEQKIEAINQFIFDEMGFRFPPHSVYAKDIDLYTYLPSVIDSRKGVCLGVSILYLALSQRLNLPLEAITPPGHIYVRYRSPTNTINIETTARGVHLDSCEYQSLELEEFKPHSMKDVIGLAYYNEASVHWQNEQYAKALQCYQKAYVYLPDDRLLQLLMGYNYLFVGEIQKGEYFLNKVAEAYKNDLHASHESVAEDYLNKKVDVAGIKSIYLHVDEKRDSLLTKKAALEKTLTQWPEFKAGHYHLAITWLQLKRTGEALTALKKYEILEKRDPSAYYLLAQLAASRADYPGSWSYLHQAEELFKSSDKLPKTLKELHRELANHSPE